MCRGVVGPTLRGPELLAMSRSSSVWVILYDRFSYFLFCL